MPDCLSRRRVSSIVFSYVRGLNARARRLSVREFVVQQRVSLVCLQETKLQVVCNDFISETLGPLFDYVFLPSEGLSGGIVVAWRRDLWVVSATDVRSFSVTIGLRELSSASGPWRLTAVFGPCSEPGHSLFLQELRDVRTTHSGLGPCESDRVL